MSVLEHRHGLRDDVVALTFDDGPSPWTGPILDLLAAHESHATFFALGCLADVDGAEQTLRRILETGSEIGNHTFSHPSLPDLDDDSIRDELERAGATIEEASGTTLRYWRPPFFHVDERVREVVSPLGLQEVGCAMMPWDWEWDAARSATFVIERLQRGSIVCMHDGRPPDEPAELSAPTREASVVAVGIILDAMTERGLRSVTISELLRSG
ncbi:MAG: polysaccharide deacetylase family protein [Gaiellaceae bacterium]